MAKLFFISIAGTLLILATIFLYIQSQEIETDTSLDLHYSVSVEVDDPAALEQNGQPLTIDGEIVGNQSLSQTQRNPLPPESNLQGSPSTQSAVPMHNFPGLDVSPPAPDQNLQPLLRQ